MGRAKKYVWNKPGQLLRSQTWIYAPYLYLRAIPGRKRYQEIGKMILFIGYPRSGSSTLASLLDAHRNILVSHEQDILNYLSPWYGRQQLFCLMERNSHLQARSGRISAGYQGFIKDQYNGIAPELKVIGDKKAGKTTARLENDPEIIHRLEAKCGLPVKCVHIIRNPFDMIATQTRKGNRKKKEDASWDLNATMDFCFRKLDTIGKIKSLGEYDILDIRLEDLIENPEKELLRILEWLGIQNYEGYLESCKAHLFDNPNVTRHTISWSLSQRKKVMQKIKEISWLKGYHFDS